MTPQHSPRRLMPRTMAVVPVKGLAAAKQRLAPALGPQLRRRLVLTMLEDVLGTLARVPAIEKVLVVTRDTVTHELLSAELARDVARAKGRSK